MLRLKPDGLDAPGDIGDINWQLALCLLLSWIIVFLCLMKGVKSSGKVSSRVTPRGAGCVSEGADIGMFGNATCSMDVYNNDMQLQLSTMR